ncbi:MAG: GNAT family N-acetyltransferase [Lachnospiraceae bacterium]
MPEGLKELPTPFYLPQEQKERSRSLYERVFREDSRRFVDYYYTYKTRDNEILAVEEDRQIVSMLHLNPYRMIVNGYEVESRYIVAVATDEHYRHRGYMRILLERALKDLAARGMPFTFLMPASESIYAPFDFAWISSHTSLPERVLRMNTEEQNRWLAERYQLFCRRDERYMENLRAQKEAEAGEAPAAQMPPYMARITDVCRMLHLIRSRKEQRLYLRVRDPLIRGNDGYFLWESAGEQARVEKLCQKPHILDMELTVGELVSFVFGGLRCCLSEEV